MKRIVILFGAIMVCMSLQAQRTKVPRKLMRDSLPVMVERCARVLDAAYMAQRLIRVDRDLEGWKGCPVSLYAYDTGYDSTVCGPKRGKVYLYNPTPERLAKWIMNACWKVKKSLDYRYTERMRKQVLYQSGGQFPVSGVVYEAMYRAGDYYPYLFKDGVTVWLADSTYFAADKHPTETQLDFYLTMTKNDLKPHTGKYARIISTTPQQYVAAGGKEPVLDGDVVTQHWLDVVRTMYKRAMKSDRNELMEIWAETNL